MSWGVTTCVYAYMGLIRKGGARAGRFVSGYDSGGMLRGMLHGMLRGYASQHFSRL